ncbi:MAG: GTP-binding protein [Deltaproteobacteria bacterium]|nr:MAG: GTP-binding protein [Deltaproteobacteria bacterium]
MSQPKPPTPAKLITGFFVKDRSLAADIVAQLQKRLGPLELASAWMDFDFTSYYEKEMGAPLSRRMLVFKPLVEQTELAGIKHLTNEVEDHYRQSGSRRVNIDPGYLLPERLVLASGKNFSHRIYMDKGIYADLTLIYRKGAFRVLPWTYPDYADGRMTDFLMLVRKRYMLELKRGPSSFKGSVEDTCSRAGIADSQFSP